MDPFYSNALDRIVTDYQRVQIWAWDQLFLGYLFYLVFVDSQIFESFQWQQTWAQLFQTIRLKLQML